MIDECDKNLEKKPPYLNLRSIYLGERGKIVQTLVILVRFQSDGKNILRLAIHFFLTDQIIIYYLID